MAQRRTKNRRSSTRRSSNITSEFNENTNIIDNGLKLSPFTNFKNIFTADTSTFL
jgi:hypothetical protein